MSDNDREDSRPTSAPNRSLKRVFGKFCQFLARSMPLMPGKLRVLLQKIHGVQFTDWTTVFLGEDVFFDDIHPEDIHIGKNVRITAGTRILTHYFDSDYEPTPDRPFRFYRGTVVIGDNVFIGVNTVIANAVQIGDGAVIGPNSVVTRNVPANAIFVGSPARQVGTRPPMRPLSGV